MRKNFKDIDINAGISAKDGLKWQKDHKIAPNWKTPEQI